MKSQTLRNNMKSFETAFDHTIPAGMYIVARLNSRGITEYTLESMIETTEHLMTCGFNITYAYTNRNEILLLFDLNESSYNRIERKFVSILASEASAKLTQITGNLATFDNRIVVLPNKNMAVRYFHSREASGESSSSYWKLEGDGKRILISMHSGEMIADLLD
jgi:tRNA(His) 5'-end guanylyltransferase